MTLQVKGTVFPLIRLEKRDNCNDPGEKRGDCFRMPDQSAGIFFKWSSEFSFTKLPSKLKDYVWVSMEVSKYIVSKLVYFTYLGDVFNLLI